MCKPFKTLPALKALKSLKVFNASKAKDETRTAAREPSGRIRDVELLCKCYTYLESSKREWKRNVKSKKKSKSKEKSVERS